jgi:hypothetical protein
VTAAGHGGVVHEVAVFPGLYASFQRYPRPATHVVEARPSSWGALPAAWEAGGLLVPLPGDEALWVGLRRDGAGSVLVGVIAEVDTGEPLDAVTGVPARSVVLAGVRAGLVVPAAAALDGIARADGGSWPFVRTRLHPGAPVCRAIHLLAAPAREHAQGQPAAPPPMLQHDVREPGQGEVEAASRTAPVEDTRWDLEASASVRIRLTDPDEFAAVTGTSLRALDERSTYRGWRLP